MTLRPLVAAALLVALTSSAALAAPTPIPDNPVPRPTGADPGQAPPQLRLPAPPALYENRSVKEALTRGDRLVYGAELSGANPATAVTMTELGGLCVLHFPATSVTASEVQGLAMAVRPSSRVILGHFTRADDPDLKQKMDAGMHGAVLDQAEDPTEVRAFLDRLFFSPLGSRPGGPAYASGFLARFSEMVHEANGAVLGGVGISTARGVERIEALVEAVEAGLTLVMVDPAGIALGGRASSREEAAEMSFRGYRHVVLGSDLSAVREAFGRYENARRDPARVPDRRPGEWNPVNRWLRQGRVAEVGFLMTPDLALARELAGHTDALWIDAEHGPFSPEAVRSLLAELPADHPVLVRVQGSDHPDIATYLQAGARGIIAPNVGSAAEAAGFVARVKGRNPQATAVSLGGASPNRTRTAEMAERGYGLVTTVSDQEAVLGTFLRKLP